MAYKPKTKHAKRTNRMRPHAHPKDADIPTRHHQIPEKVARGKPLNHPTPARVPVHPLEAAHFLPLLIHIHDPQGGRVDGARLHEGDDVDVPVYLRAPVEMRVDLGEEEGGEEGGDDGLDGLVEDERGYQFVDVEGEGEEGEVVG